MPFTFCYCGKYASHFINQSINVNFHFDWKHFKATLRLIPSWAAPIFIRHCWLRVYLCVVCTRACLQFRCYFMLCHGNMTPPYNCVHLIAKIEFNFHLKFITHSIRVVVLHSHNFIWKSLNRYAFTEIGTDRKKKVYANIFVDKRLICTVWECDPNG